MAAHEVNTHWQSGFAFDALVNGHTIRMDDTVESGGGGTGPTPKPLLLAALAGCTGIDVVGMLTKMRVPFSDFDLDVRGELTDEVPKIYRSIHLIYTIRVAENDRPKMEKAVALSEEKYCGVSIMLSKVCKITYEIRFL